MTCHRTLLAAACLLVSLGGGCDSTPAPSPQDVFAGCTPGGDGTYRSALYPRLADYCMVAVSGGTLIPRDGVTPYELNSPLFTDYAVKYRTVWVPSGTQVAYATDTTDQVLDFPVGTIITKSFGYRADLRDATSPVTWVETRVLVRQDEKWKGVSYAWDAAQSGAEVNYGGGYVDGISWLDEGGAKVVPTYVVPNGNQCITCHAVDNATSLLGPKARNLNRDFDYDTGRENQLVHWSRIGLLSGAPKDPAQMPRLAAAHDPASGSLDDRARAYLEANCAHCHSSRGFARTTGLYLWASEQAPDTLGVCKPPVAVGEASGGFLYDIVGGDPDHSIMVFRMESTAPAVMMPQIGRSLVDKEGVALVREWITSLKGRVPACNGR